MSELLKSVDMRTDLAGRNRMEMLVFHLGTKQSFGINVFKVKEVYINPQITRLPESHPAVLGATNFRGKSIILIDIAHAIGMKPLSHLETKTIITSEYNMSMQGLLVGGVEKIINISWDEIHNPPIGTGSESGSYIVGITDVGGTLVEIVDVEKILHQISPKGDLISPELLEDESIQAVRNKEFKVLIAEDSAFVRKKITRSLEQMDLLVTPVNNGLQAYRLLEEDISKGINVTEKYLLLISDIEMPEMDGYTLASKIRNNPKMKDLFIVLHSSMSGEFNERLVEKVGADHFISKFQPDEFAKMVRERVRRAKL